MAQDETAKGPGRAPATEGAGAAEAAEVQDVPAPQPAAAPAGSAPGATGQVPSEPAENGPAVTGPESAEEPTAPAGPNGGSVPAAGPTPVTGRGTAGAEQVEPGQGGPRRVESDTVVLGAAGLRKVERASAGPTAEPAAERPDADAEEAAADAPEAAAAPAAVAEAVPGTRPVARTAGAAVTAAVAAAVGDGAAEAEPVPGTEPAPISAAVTAPATASAPRPVPTAGGGRKRLRAAMWPPRVSRGQLVVALLLFSLGLALAIQVRSTNDHNQLRGARQEDLVRILDELDSRQQRLQQEKAQLEQSMAQLENSSNQAKEAQEQTRKKSTELGVLAGTVKATGPGIVLTVDDPQGQVKADMLLDTLQELRAAGAEAIQINDVRVVVNTYFTDTPGGGVQIDGKKISQPYRFTVVGNPQDLTPALNIPGGVVRTLESHQARATIAEQQKIVVDALAELRTPQYAKPAAK